MMSAATGKAMNARRDPPTISSTDHARLAGIATAGTRFRRVPPSARFLSSELGHARIVGASELPEDVVSMHSAFEFQDGTTDQVRRATLVYPGEEDGDFGRISVLSPLGAALIGTAAGQSIQWRGAASTLCTLRVLRVLDQP
jgi:regulator of nucleoside diphosphate kinase